MSHFQTPGQKMAWLEARLNMLDALVRGLIAPDGTISQIPANFVGTLTEHEHTGAGDGGDLEFAPAVFADWKNSLDPGGVWEALDQLAERVQDLDTLTVPAVTMLFSGMEE